MYFMLAISALLFPFAKFLVETLALKYTTREYWSRDCLLRPRQRMASTLFTIWLASWFQSRLVFSICSLRGKAYGSSFS
ncbi:colicin E1 family microcin immunity protein [Serratia fonticola]